MNNKSQWKLREFVEDSKYRVYRARSKNEMEPSDIDIMYYDNHKVKKNPYSKFILCHSSGKRSNNFIGDPNSSFIGLPSERQINFIKKKALTKKDRSKGHFHRKYWKFENKEVKTDAQFKAKIRNSRGIKTQPLEIISSGGLIIPNVDNKFGKYAYTAFGYQVLIDSKGGCHAFIGSECIFSAPNEDSLQVWLTI